MTRAALPSEKGEDPAHEKREEKTRSVKEKHTTIGVALFIRSLSKMGHPCYHGRDRSRFLGQSYSVTVWCLKSLKSVEVTPHCALTKGYEKMVSVSSLRCFAVMTVPHFQRFTGLH